MIYHPENRILALRKIREVTKLVAVIDTQVMKFNPKLGTQESIKTAFGTKNVIRETDAMIGLYDENCWSMTGLECYPNKAALYKMLKSVGFSEIIQLEPPNNAYEQYVNFDRVIVVAKV